MWDVMQTHPCVRRQLRSMGQAQPSVEGTYGMTELCIVAPICRKL
jgi:hypothetical protein